MWENLTSELEHFIGVRTTMPDRIIQNPERGDICRSQRSYEALAFEAPRIESNANPSPRSSKASRQRHGVHTAKLKKHGSFTHMRLFQATVED
jgi:hypothetical protein